MAKSLIHKDISNFHNVTSLLKSMGYMLKSDRLLGLLGPGSGLAARAGRCSPVKRRGPTWAGDVTAAQHCHVAGKAGRLASGLVASDFSGGAAFHPA
jgi:hypothetical protein